MHPVQRRQQPASGAAWGRPSRLFNHANYFRDINWEEQEARSKGNTHG